MELEECSRFRRWLAGISWTDQTAVARRSDLSSDQECARLNIRARPSDHLGETATSVEETMRTGDILIDLEISTEPMIVGLALAAMAQAVDLSLMAAARKALAQMIAAQMIGDPMGRRSVRPEFAAREPVPLGWIVLVTANSMVLEAEDLGRVARDLTVLAQVAPETKGLDRMDRASVGTGRRGRRVLNPVERLRGMTYPRRTHRSPSTETLENSLTR